MWDFENYNYRQRQPGTRNKRVVIPVREERTYPPQSPMLPETKKPDEPQTAVANNRANDWQEKYLRLAADLDNSKKRLAKNYANQYEQDKEALLRDFLPIADNLERALAHATGQQGEAAMRQGVELTYKAFMETLARHGVKPIDARGKLFDPALHDAVATLARPGVTAGTVLQVEETGYTMNNKLLRPARVLVAG